jgi:hydroxymethylpyrimidine/phosphomethylpyrimidine kinase
LSFSSARVATPNRFEAEALSGIRIATLEDSHAAAQKLLEYGAQLVVVKGGAFETDAAAVAASADGTLSVLRSERIETSSVHGTGCTFSAAIAAYLAHGEDPIEAVRKAKIYVTEALRHAYPVGRGKGPVNHFWKR